MLRNNSPLRYKSRTGFTIIELLVAIAIFIVMLAVTVSVVGHTASLWRRSSGTIEAFQSARFAFDLVTRQLSQATLNAYLDYDNLNAPTRYLRKSELQFVCGVPGDNSSGNAAIPGTPDTGTAVFFQAPISYTANATNFSGLGGALNTCGFYITFGTNSFLPAFASNNHYRYRLMGLQVPMESNLIYSNTNQLSSDYTWFAPPPPAFVFPIADNIIALIVHPLDPDPVNPTQFTTLNYNSLENWLADPQPVTANQLPPVMLVTLVAIDEASAKRLENSNTPPPSIAAALSTFQSTLEANPVDSTAALSQLGTALAAKHINYRIFSTSVPMRESKWTKN